MRATIIDFETNRFKGSDVLSFSYAHDDGGLHTEVRSRFYYPRGEYNKEAIAVNGLSEEKITLLRGNATYPQHYDEDEAFVASVFSCTDVIVAHNIAFDNSFVYFLPHKCDYFCTMKANTKYFDKNPKLKEAAALYGIEVLEESLHGSAYDVELCLAIYNAMNEKDKAPNDDFLTKVYAARGEYGEKIHPFGEWKGCSAEMFDQYDCEAFLKKYHGPHTHEMYDEVAERLEWFKSVEYDNMAVDEFARMMRMQLAKKRREGKRGWSNKESCSDDDLAKKFFEHLEKCNEGNFVDLANYLMFLHIRGAKPNVLAIFNHPFNVEGEAHEVVGLTILETYKELLSGKGLVPAKLMDKAIHQLKDLEHFSHYTSGLWCTDRPDLIPQDIRNNEKIWWQLNFWEAPIGATCVTCKYFCRYVNIKAPSTAHCRNPKNIQFDDERNSAYLQVTDNFSCNKWEACDAVQE